MLQNIDQEYQISYRMNEISINIVSKKKLKYTTCLM